MDKGPIQVPAALTAMRQQQGDLKVIRDLLVFYFAHVMAATEDFITTQSPWRNFDFSNAEKDQLVFQLAVPTGLLDNDGATERLFQKSFIAAYELRRKVDPDMRQARSYPEWTAQVANVMDPGLETLKVKYKWQCLIYPEVLAQCRLFFDHPILNKMVST